MRAKLAQKQSDWERMEARSRDLVRMGKQRSVNTPSQGTVESWEQLTALYIARATVLVDTAQRQDQEEGAACGSAHEFEVRRL